MCRLLGAFSMTGAGLEGELGRELGERFLSLSRLHSDGWGGAWLEGNSRTRVARQRDPHPPSEPASARRARQFLAQKASAAIVHLRMATPGMPYGHNHTHPFLADGVAFAHNGAILPRDQLRALGPHAASSPVSGETDSEIYFGIVRRFVADRGDLLEGVCAAVREIRGEFPTASLNALMMSPRQMIAVHASTMTPSPLGDGARGDMDLPPGHEDEYFQMFYRRGPDGSVCFASSGLETAQWCPMPPDTVAAVDLDTGQLSLHDVGSAGGAVDNGPKVERCSAALQVEPALIPAG